MGWLTWLLGPMPQLQREERSGALLTLVVCTAALSFLIDLRFPLGSRYLLNDTWTVVVYMALPMVSVAWWEVVRGGRGHALAALGSALVLSPIAAHLASDRATELLRQHPLVLLGVAAAGVVALGISARMAGARLSQGWGLGLGDWRWWGPRAAVLGGLMLLMIATVAWASPEMRDFYPQYRPARQHLSALLGYQAAMAMYMLGWEFFFRGFLLFGLARRGDTLLALYFHAIPFFLLHRGKPEVEMVASFIGSILIGWFALRARSFLPAWLLHWGMNLSMESVAFAWRHLS
ncbi:MAG: CPBP family intramembrane metalloprotease [Deltaproteobacteria bacterium]|nr:CPBP family intramembrane metalloprotease [Deltaproteobacteria bacterium]